MDAAGDNTFIAVSAQQGEMVTSLFKSRVGFLFWEDCPWKSAQCERRERWPYTSAPEKNIGFNSVFWLNSTSRGSKNFILIMFYKPWQIVHTTALTCRNQTYLKEWSRSRRDLPLRDGVCRKPFSTPHLFIFYVQWLQYCIREKRYNGVTHAFLLYSLQALMAQDWRGREGRWLNDKWM